MLNSSTAANTANITLGADISVAGPVRIYGGALALNANLTTTHATTQAARQKARRHETMSSATKAELATKGRHCSSNG